MTTTAPLRCAVVGVGRVAVKNYLPSLVAAGCSLAYLTRSADKARAAAETFGGVVLEDFDELSDWRPDVTFVLTTDSQHHVVLAELIARGIARIFVEKPLVAARGQAHVDESDLMTAIDLLGRAEASGSTVAVGFNYRFFDLVQQASGLAVERGWGALTGLSACAHYACWSHVIDLLLRFGGPIDQLTGLEGATPHGEEPLRAPDRVVAFTTASGAGGTLHGTGASGWDDDLLEITAQYEGGRFTLRDLDGSLTIVDGVGERNEVIHPAANGNRWERYDASFTRSIAAYLATVSAGSPPPVSGHDGVAELAVEAAIRRSIDAAERVSLAGAR